MKKPDRQSDHYKTLGVAPSATADEIKKAYRKLARQYHPDVSKAPDAEARFKEIGRANQVLKDPERRAAYDRGEEPDNPDGSSPNPSAHRPPPGWQPGFDSQGGFSGSPFGGEEGLDAESILEAFMGHQRRAGARGGARPRAPQRQRGEDYSAELLIDLADSYHGAQRPVHLQVPVHNARGQVVMTERTLQVTIPRGLRAGQHLRLAGQGGPGHSSVPGDDPASLAGDLLLQVAFRPHPHFTVQGGDVLLGLPLAPWEAALGASIAVPTPTGQVMMTIPPGTPEGRSLRLRGQGLPASGAGKHAGNLVATVHIAWPPASTEAERLAYTAMQAAFAGFEARATLT